MRVPSSASTILLVLAGAERGDDEGLRLAAGEQRRAVRARQHVHLGEDRAHGLEVATVDAPAGLDDVAAHDLAFERLEGVAEQHLLAGIVGDLDASEARLLLGLR